MIGFQDLKTQVFLTITEPFGLFSNIFSIVAITHSLTPFLKTKTQVFETLSLFLNSYESRQQNQYQFL